MEIFDVLCVVGGCLWYCWVLVVLRLFVLF
jgi:hypothetical protein